MATAEKNVVILGSTGSVGTQALDVVRGAPERFAVAGLSAHSNWRSLAEQIREFRPAAAAVSCPEVAGRLREALDGPEVQMLHGTDGLCRLAGWEGAQVVLSAISGAAGLNPAVAALEAGKTLALANKEAVVMAGGPLLRLARGGNGTLLPVDSEHSATFQLLRQVDPREVRRVVLTASGGPFRGMSRAELEAVGPEDALEHPTWQMGPKITVDSATLMNKALEVIEARWLFDLPPEKIGVVIHPQSVVHCLVEQVDGSVLAHMGVPDMRMPIQYALGWPERLPDAAERLDWARLSGLQFEEPDLEAFPALGLGFRVARTGGTSGAVLSAANEVAVEGFLNGLIRFTDIVKLVEEVLDRHSIVEEPTFAQSVAADRWAREEARSCLDS